jgi:hypothetical protein
MLNLLSLAGRLARDEASLGPASPRIADRSPWDGFADACPCGLAAGECREHPRARAAQRPPAGDWRWRAENLALTKLSPLGGSMLSVAR